MIYVGVDPDTTGTGLAAVQDGKVLAVHVVEACDEEYECSCMGDQVMLFACKASINHLHFRFAVEDQEYRHGNSKGSPAPLFKVAHAAGAAFACLSSQSLRESGQFVSPMTWKGSVPKLQHHRRLCTKLGWLWEERGGKAPYVVPISMPPSAPAGYADVKTSQWSEVLDAIGIALWLKEKHHGR